MKQKKHILALIALCLMWFSLFLEVEREGPCTIDEPAWITTGYITFQLVSTLSSISQWETAYDEAHLGDWGNKNPPLGKLIIGAVVALSKKDSDSMRYSWDWKSSYADNLRAGRLPPRHLLKPARHAIAAMGAAVLLLLYVIAFQLTASHASALLAPIFVFSTPVFQVHAVRVYTDIPQLLFLLSSVVFSLAHMKTSKLFWLALSLIFLGFSCAVKFSSGPAVVALLVFILLRRSSLKKKILNFIAVLILPFLIFSIVNPYLYRNPIGRTAALISDWKTSKERQKTDPILARQSIPARWAGLVTATARGVLKPTQTPPFGSKMLARFQKHSPMILGLLATIVGLLALLGHRPYFRSSRKTAFVAGSIFGLGFLVEVWLFGSGGASTGLFFLGAWAVYSRSLSRSDDSDEDRRRVGFFSILFISILLMTGWWLPFDWARYYLPIIALSSVLGAVGVHNAMSCVALKKKDPSFLKSWPLARLTCRVVLVLVALMFASLTVLIVTGPMI